MKYIRTKDGIIKSGCGSQFRLGKKGYYEVEEKEDCFGNSRYVVKRYIKNAIKSADTIEELCDFYVIWLKNRELPLIEKIRKGIKPHLSYFETDECSFDKGYGAIWTNKGLIYVAKMNDKGELELLWNTKKFLV